MSVTTAMTLLLCAVGVAFYVRFFVALCKECKPSSIGYWVRLRLSSGEDATPELHERNSSESLAA